MAFASGFTQIFKGAVWIGRNAIPIEEESCEGEAAGRVYAMEGSTDNEGLNCRIKISCFLPGEFSTLTSRSDSEVMLEGNLLPRTLNQTNRSCFHH